MAAQQGPQGAPRRIGRFVQLFWPRTAEIGENSQNQGMTGHEFKTEELPESPSLGAERVQFPVPRMRHE